MSQLVSFYQRALGKKLIVAVTGLVMLGFLVGHVAGNLKVFLPPAAASGKPDIDAYAEGLRSLGEPLVPHGAFLWTARVVLAASLILHVVCVLQLSGANLAARPIDYDKRKFVATTPPTRWMMYTGLLLLLFVVFHVVHLTLGGIQPDKFRHGHVYENLYLAFANLGLTNLALVAIYAASMIILALHLSHGIWSLFQTLGLDNPDRNQLLRRFALVVAVGLAVGFVSVPAAFFVGALRQHEATEVTSSLDSQQPETKER